MEDYPEDEPITNFTSVNFARDANPPQGHCCRQCSQQFPTSNQLFAHLEQTHTIERMTNKPALAASALNADTRSKSKKAYKAANPPKPSPLTLADTTPTMDSLLIVSSANSETSIGMGYGFRPWHYVLAKVAFGKPSDAIFEICLDSRSSLSIASKAWIQTNYPQAQPRTRAKPVSVGGVGINKSSTTQYIIADLFSQASKTINLYRQRSLGKSTL